MDTIQLGSVQSTINNKVAYITFEHPSHNSLPSFLLASLKKEIDVLAEDKDVLVIVLQSAGEKTFCAGASFDELAAIQDFQTGKKFFMGFANIINSIRKCPKIVIARIQGKAIGGGVGLAAACDYCLATSAASIKLSELAIGIGPFVIGPAVQRKMRLSAFSQLAIDATTFQTAVWAKEKGLYHEVFDTIVELDTYLASFSEKLSDASPDALRMLKKIFWEGTENWDELLDERAAMSGLLVLSDFSKNAIASFKNK